MASDHCAKFHLKNPNNRLNAVGTVCRRVGVESRVTIFRRVKAGCFPPPDAVISGRNYWLTSTIDHYIAEQVARSGAEDEQEADDDDEPPDGWHEDGPAWDAAGPGRARERPFSTRHIRSVSMIAREITEALGGRWYGGYGLARCPAHNDREPSLAIHDAEGGRLLWRCHGGCDQAKVLDALRRRGLLDTDHRRAAKSERTNRNVDRALEIWRESQPANGTVVETYLRGRGISIPVPATIRHHPNLRHGPTALTFPALVAAVQAPTGKVVAVHRTFLLPDGSGKAKVTSPKMALGSIGAGAVRLGAAKSAMGLAEGIETALSAEQLFAIPIWVALGSRMDRVEPPSWIVEVQIFADNGSAGEDAAKKGKTELRARGYRVCIRFPPEHFEDWNEALVAEKGSGHAC